MDNAGFKPKTAWGITGAGHFLLPCLELLLSFNRIDIFLSKAAYEVLRFYGYDDMLKSSGKLLFLDTSASCCSMTGLYTGKYDLVVIAPITSNSIAKMVNGIADNLITNLFAHAGKCHIPTILLPCDSLPEIQSVTPQGNEVSVCVRKIDRINIERLAEWDGIRIAKDPEQLRKMINKISVKPERASHEMSLPTR